MAPTLLAVGMITFVGAARIIMFVSLAGAVLARLFGLRSGSVG